MAVKNREAVLSRKKIYPPKIEPNKTENEKR